MQSENFLADQTLIACDVCGEINPGGNGGVLLLDKDKTCTLECQDCWENFTSLPPDQRKIKNNLVAMALIQEVGTDPISHELLDPNKSFIHNVYAIRAQNLKKTSHYHDIGDKGLKVKFYPEVKEDTTTFKYCAQCLYLMPRKSALFCGQCKLCTYCNKDCQRKDWPRHKVTCKEFAKVKAKFNNTQ